MADPTPDRNPVKNAIRRLIRWAVTETDASESGTYQTQQISYLGRPGKSASAYPYGFSANAPKGVLAVLLSISGQSDARAHMPISGPKRIRLASGEVVVFHPNTGSKVHFRSDGSIEVDAKADVRVTAAGAITAVAGTTLTATAAVSAAITAPTVTITGNLVVTGTLNIAGAATFGAAITDLNGIDHVTHKHTYLISGSPNDTSGPETP